MLRGAMVGLGTALALGGCARPLLGPDDGDATSSSSDVSTGAQDESTSTTDVVPVPECHASYSPCLPLVDDLDCADVVAMGKAPVVVAGPDDYGLDADGDGVGCEQR